MAYTATDIAKLYIAMFDRAPEQEGLNYWLNQANNGMSLSEIANAMADAAKTLYPSDYPDYANYNPQDANSVEAVINDIYKVLFNKDSSTDPDGVNYWVNEITSGKMDLGTAVVTLEKAAEEYLNSDDAAAKAAAETFMNRVDAAVKIADVLPTADINGDGKIDSTDFQVFKDTINTVTDDSTTIDKAVQEAEDYAPKSFDLTDGKDNIVGTDGANTFNADLLTLNDGDSIDGKGGVDTLKATINSDVNDLTLTSVEKAEFTSYGNHAVNLSKATGLEEVASVDSTGTLSFKNLTSKVGLKLVGTSQKVTGNYSGLSGSNDVLNLALSKATNATVSVSNGFEKLDLNVDGDNSISSFTNMPSKVTVDGSGSLNLKTNVTLSTLTVNGDVSLSTGKDTTQDGFNDSQQIKTNTGGTTITLGNGENNINVADGSNAGDTNTILGGNKTDKITISKKSANFVIKAGDGDDSVLVNGTASYTNSDVIDLGSGNDTLVINNSQNNSLVLRGVENVTLKNTATGTNSLISDEANKITVQAGNGNTATAFGLKKLADGSTVHVVDAKNTTAGFKSATISYAKAQDSATITFDAKAALTGALKITNVKNLSIVANKAITGAAAKNLSLKAATKLDLTGAKKIKLANITDSATTDTLKSIKVKGSATVTLGNMSKITSLETANISAAKTLKVGKIGTTTKDTNLKSVTLKSTNGKIIKNAALTIGNNKATLTKVNIQGAKTVTVTKISGKDLGNITIKSNSKAATLNTIKAANSLKSLSLKGTAAKITTGLLSAKTLGKVNVSATAKNVTVKQLKVTGTKEIGNINLYSKQGNVKVTTGISATKAGKGFSNIKISAPKGNITLNKITAKDTNGFNVTLKAGKSGKIGGAISANGSITGALTIKNIKGNISNVVLAGKTVGTSANRVKISAVTGTGYVKTVNAKNVTNGANLTIKSNDTSAAITSKTTVSLGGNNSVTNNVKFLGKVDAIDVTGGAANDKINLNVSSKVDASLNLYGGNDTVTISQKAANSTISINGGTGGDTIIDKAVFNAVDKIKDFGNETTNNKDIFKVDLVTTAGGGTGYKFKSSKKVGTNYVNGSHKLQVLQISNYKVKKAMTAILSKKLTTAGSNTVGAKALLVGKNLKISNNKLILTTKSAKKTITKLTSTAGTITHTGVLFFYDTDDHKLQMYGIYMKNKQSNGANDTAIDTIVSKTHKTLATITLHSGYSFTAGDIAIF